jgi:hypothetical protein
MTSCGSITDVFAKVVTDNLSAGYTCTIFEVRWLGVLDIFLLFVFD